MSKPLRFTRAEITSAAKIAKEHGVAVKLGADGSLMIIPDKHTLSGVDQGGEGGGTFFQKWKEARNAGKACGRPHG